jgi:hypothetical protein
MMEYLGFLMLLRFLQKSRSTREGWRKDDYNTGLHDTGHDETQNFKTLFEKGESPT